MHHSFAYAAILLSSLGFYPGAANAQTPVQGEGSPSQTRGAQVQQAPSTSAPPQTTPPSGNAAAASVDPTQLPRLSTTGQPAAYYDPATGNVLLVPQGQLMRVPPQELPYVEGQRIPPGFAINEYHPRGLIIGGSVTLGVLWLLSISVASSNDYSGADGWLALPVIGPFAWLATKKKHSCDSSTSYCFDNDVDDSSSRTLVTFDGLGQVAGAAMLIAGLAITRKNLVLVNPAATISVAPFATSKASGLALVGQF